MVTGLAVQQTELLEVVDGVVTLRLVWPDRPWTVNEAVGAQNPRAVAHYRRLTKEWGAVFTRLAQSCPAMLWCDVDVQLERPNKSGWPDTGSAYLAVKAALDGIVAAGVLADDDPDHVHDIVMRPPMVTGRDALVITLIGPAA